MSREDLSCDLSVRILDARNRLTRLDPFAATGEFLRRQDLQTPRTRRNEKDYRERALFALRAVGGQVEASSGID